MARFDLAFPYRIDRRARTAASDYSSHIREMIEQLLFTAPGERVNRPDFGSGLHRMTFEPIGDALAAALQFTIQGTLQQYLGDRIELERVDVAAVESTLRVTVAYRVRLTGEQEIVTFEGVQ